METKSLARDSVEVDSVDKSLVVKKKAKKVRFSPENEVFEFTRSVKKRKLKKRREVSGTELRRSKRIGSEGIKVTEVMGPKQFDDLKSEKVERRSTRLITQDLRRSTRLANLSMRGCSADGNKLLCSVMESKEEIKTKQSKGSPAVNSKKAVNEIVQISESCRMMKVEDVAVVENVPRRSKRLGKNVNVLMDKRLVKVVKRDDHHLGVEKISKQQSRQLETSVNELLVDGQAKMSDRDSKRRTPRARIDLVDKRVLQSSNCAALDNMMVQEIRDGSSVDIVKKLSVKSNQMQVCVRFTRSSSRQKSFEAPIVKKTDETLGSFVKSSKRITRSMKQVLESHL